jgi:hypothetical protein
MENATIKHIKKLDTQIAALEKILKSKEYLAAGLLVAVNVGVPEDDCTYDINNITIGVFSGNEEKVLKLLLESIKASREKYMEYLQEELKIIEAFLTF